MSKVICSKCGNYRIEIVEDEVSYVLHKYVRRYDKEEGQYYETRELPNPSGRYSDIDSAIGEAKRLIQLLGVVT